MSNPTFIFMYSSSSQHPDTGLVDEELAQIARTKYETDTRKFCLE
jgi:hypothetical protein